MKFADDRRTASLPIGAVTVAVLMLLSACAARDIMATDASGYVSDAEQQVAAVDWSTAETIDIALSEYTFMPSSLLFMQGHAYRLHLANRGSGVHDFASKPFFQAIAAAKLVAPDRTTSLPRLESIGIRPGEAKDLYFVALRPGSYPFECGEPLHSAFGMTGTARIE